MVAMSLRLLAGNPSFSNRKGYAEWSHLITYELNVTVYFLHLFWFYSFLELKKVEDNFIINLISVWSSVIFSVEYISRANIHKIRYVLQINFRRQGLTVPIKIMCQSWWRQFSQWNQVTFCDSRQNNIYNRDSRNVFIWRRYKCLILYCHEIVIFHLPALYPNGCRLIFPVLFYLNHGVLKWLLWLILAAWKSLVQGVPFLLTVNFFMDVSSSSWSLKQKLCVNLWQHRLGFSSPATCWKSWKSC